MEHRIDTWSVTADGRSGAALSAFVVCLNQNVTPSTDTGTARHSDAQRHGGMAHVVPIAGGPSPTQPLGGTDMFQCVIGA